MKLPKVENLGFIGIVVIVALLFFYFILGFSGMMTALGIMLLFIAPIYFILDNFDLEQDEKIVFSFFLGIGIFPSIVYLLGLIISFRLSIAITFVVLIGLAIVLRKYRNSKSSKISHFFLAFKMT